MYGVIARISIRYGVGVLVGTGILTETFGASLADDPDVAHAIEIGLPLAVGAATEVWYWAARKWSWGT